MVTFDSFVYLLSDVAEGYAELLDFHSEDPNDPDDTYIMVLESGVTSVYGPEITSEQLEELQAIGDVFAYVNVAVTDSNRDWWQASWTINPQTMLPFEDDGSFVGEVRDGANTEEANLATVGGAPAWFVDPYGEATGPVEEEAVDGIPNYGPIVDFSDGAITEQPTGSYFDATEENTWWHIVLGQVWAQMEAGYRGIFLDDVSRYAWLDLDDNGVATAEENRQAANEMMDLIKAIQHDIALYEDMHDVQIQLATNGGGFLGGNTDTTYNVEEDKPFYDAIDYIVMENIVNENPQWFWEIGHQVLNEIGSDTTLLSIEWQNGLDNPELYAAYITWLQDNGVNIEGHVPPTADYNTVGTPLEVTPTPDFSAEFGTFQDNAITGTDGANILGGLAGNDTIDGGAGDDLILGGTENDSLIGGDGDDTIYGSDGDDIIFGSAGDDLIYAGAGNDTIYGGGGNDTIIGGDGNDVISGGDGMDVLTGGNGLDTIYGGDIPDDFAFV